MTQSFEHKYQPTSLDEFVFPSKRCENEIRAWIEVMPTTPLLLHGKNGRGKSTLAKLLYFEIYPDEPRRSSDILEITATTQSSPAKMIKNIENFASLVPYGNGNRMVIIDELDSFPAAIQKALKSTLDYYSTYSHFVFTTNHEDKIRPGIQSRCHLVRIGSASITGWKKRLKFIFEQEGLQTPNHEELLGLISDAKGDCRKILQGAALKALSTPKLQSQTPLKISSELDVMSVDPPQP